MFSLNDGRMQNPSFFAAHDFAFMEKMCNNVEENDHEGELNNSSPLCNNNSEKTVLEEPRSSVP